MPRLDANKTLRLAEFIKSSEVRNYNQALIPDTEIVKRFTEKIGIEVSTFSVKKIRDIYKIKCFRERRESKEKKERKSKLNPGLDYNSEVLALLRKISEGVEDIRNRAVEKKPEVQS